MRARKVKELDAHGPLDANAERIIRARLDELCSFMPRAADPAQVVALHDMRIAAKRLRYVLEVFGPVFGPYAEKAIDVVKDLQDLLGDIHDCDVQLPETGQVLADLVDEDARVLAAGGEPPHQATYAGLVGMGVRLKADREVLFGRFLEAWRDVQRTGFRARLEFALTERSHLLHNEE